MSLEAMISAGVEGGREVDMARISQQRLSGLGLGSLMLWVSQSIKGSGHEQEVPIAQCYPDSLGQAPLPQPNQESWEGH